MNFFQRQLLVHVQMSRGSYLLALSPPLMPHHQLYLMLFLSLLWATAALVSGKDILPHLCFPISDQAFTVSSESNINLWPCSSLHPDWKQYLKHIPPSKLQRGTSGECTFCGNLVWTWELCCAALSRNTWRKGTGLREPRKESGEVWQM